MGIIRYFTQTASVTLTLATAIQLMAFAQTNDNLLDVSFDNHSLGPYTYEQVAADWENVNWVRLNDRASIVEDPHPDRGQVLQITYPQGAVGPRQGGGQFAITLPPAEEMWLSYYVKFDRQFDFKQGGKLPGLASGGSQYTGGRRPVNGDGWSARYMWKKRGRAVNYLYYVDMPGQWGENLPLEDFHFVPGTWHRVTQHIKLNTANEANGILETWIDGKPYQARSDIRFRLGSQGLIDTFLFSTFHGGSRAEWAPRVDSIAFFDDFVVTTEAPSLLMSLD